MGHSDSSDDKTPFVQIRPADLTLSSATAELSAAQEEKKAGKTFWLGVLIGGLVGLALLVILLLPDHIQKPAAPELINDQPTNSLQAKQTKPEPFPWQEAQLGKQRKAAQDVLETPEAVAALHEHAAEISAVLGSTAYENHLKGL